MSADHFDEWYSRLARSSRRNTITQSALGLPADFESTSLLSWDGIAEVVDALALRADQTLVDLACGLGAYGREVASRAGARLIGVDFSAVAVKRAASRTPRADYVIGELTAVGIADRSADAIMCIDAMQFAEPYEAGLAECLRVLVPGGRLVLTGWEPRRNGDETMPARLRRNIADALRVAGFSGVDVREMTSWRNDERALWTMAIESDPAGDPAMESLRGEGLRVLPWLDRSRRVMAVARRP